MIEGIVILFVILFLILVVPFIKDAWTRYNKPNETYKVMEHSEPKQGDIWFW